MAAHTVMTFGGTAPKVAAHQLEDHQATVAENCTALSGRLEPIMAPLALANLVQGDAPQGLAKIGANWISWDSDIDLVASLIGDIKEEYHKGEATAGTTTSLTDANSPFKRLGVAPGMVLHNLDTDIQVVLSGVGDTSLTHAAIATTHSVGDRYLITYTDGIDGRFYYTGNGAPRKSNVTLTGTGAGSGGPAFEYLLQVPRPLTAVVAELTGTGYAAWDVALNYTVEDTIKYDGAYYKALLNIPAGSPPPGTNSSWSQIPGKVWTTAYVYTLETLWGEESQPSRDTAPIIVELDQVPRLTNITVPTSMAHSIAFVNIYRLSVGTNFANYQLVERLESEHFATVQDFYDDSVPAEHLGRTLLSRHYTTPPEALEGLLAFNNSVYVGFVKNEIFFSEPNQPHAWPVDYVITLPAQIIGLGTAENTLYALTDGNPYMIIGEDPRAVSVIPLPEYHPCLAKRGIVSSPYGVFYPSKDGYRSRNSQGPKNLTAELYTPAQWKALGPENIVACFFEDTLFWFFKGTNRGGLLNMAEPANIKTLKLPFTIHGALVVAEGLFLIGHTEADGYTLQQYAAGPEPLTYIWRSKDFLYAHDKTLAAAKIMAAGRVDFSYFVNGQVQTFAGGANQKMVISEHSFRLPGPSRGRRFAFQVKGTSPLTLVGIADSVGELK